MFKFTWPVKCFSIKKIFNKQNLTVLWRNFTFSNFRKLRVPRLSASHLHEHQSFIQIKLPVISLRNSMLELWKDVFWSINIQGVSDEAYLLYFDITFFWKSILNFRLLKNNELICPFYACFLFLKILTWGKSFLPRLGFEPAPLWAKSESHTTRLWRSVSFIAEWYGSLSFYS